VLNIQDNVCAHFDKYYITQTLDNLIVNAMQYGENGMITITLKVRDDNTVLFSIQDEGIGIPQNQLEDIFETFTTSSLTKSGSGNRGIGLTLCKKVIVVHHGEIWAESNSPKGSALSFTMPVVQQSTKLS
ncbi:MAG: sensor histidine kinase, partial [Rickettsiaceae bacterium]